ncbi:SEFIR domain-containing protein [Pseudorhodobacter aquimaris]|uniref:SEFIR domain-containing protein n=1 Tax=Pseudorhodobacter aquimaris TaxID=687412 RepID=UPI00067CECA7|nr:SEFIR domain-containing protein [Pseudorhodobacter aquimaris]
MSDIQPAAPKAFISYSWSSSDHEARVLDLATDLRSAGVDAILDKWDLREGQESTAFMEQMVTDKGIQKVIIVSDRVYAEKSDQRSGGAGTEAQIISPKLYSGEDEGKFVALVFERDEHGNACLPTYYTSRIFIDFTDLTRATDSFEQLVRWIFDKPLYKKPDVGRPPAYLKSDEATITLATSAAHRRAMDAVQNSKPHAFAATQEYLETLTDQLEAFRINVETDPLSDEISSNYAAFLPYRDEAITLVRAIARAEPETRYGDALHAFLERFIPYFHATPESGRHRKFDFDNYKFFAHELLLYFCTIAMTDGRSDLFDAITGRPYYDAVRGENGGNAVGTYDVFFFHDSLLDHRNKQLELRRHSLHADLLKERAAGSGFRFEQLIQTDFVLFLRNRLLHAESYYFWFPVTMYLLSYGHRPFEIFARAQSTRELMRLLPLLGIEDRVPLDELVKVYSDDPQKAPRFNDGWDCLDIGRLTGHDQLGSRP